MSNGKKKRSLEESPFFMGLLVDVKLDANFNLIGASVASMHLYLAEAISKVYAISLNNINL